MISLTSFKHFLTFQARGFKLSSNQQGSNVSRHAERRQSPVVEARRGLKAHLLIALTRAASPQRMWEPSVAYRNLYKEVYNLYILLHVRGPYQRIY